MTQHKIMRTRLQGKFIASCVCGWATKALSSAPVSLAVAAHRTEAGLNPKVAP